jgi:hypothetical protein
VTYFEEHSDLSAFSFLWLFLFCAFVSYLRNLCLSQDHKFFSPIFLCNIQLTAVAFRPPMQEVKDCFLHRYPDIVAPFIK